MVVRTEGISRSAAAVPAAAMVRTHDRTIPAYASSSQVPEGVMVSAVQQK
ncbi:hypothetical protein ACVNF4_11510 [Streptomyces sp. S6]